jgi:hypothetical protein
VFHAEHSKRRNAEIQFLAKAIDGIGSFSYKLSPLMGQQLKERTKQRRRVLRKKRLKVRAREAAAAKK